jgi:hypothetical protein
MHARIYDLRSTFASNALAAGVTVFELARVGTSVAMVERHYGTLPATNHANGLPLLRMLNTSMTKAGTRPSTGACGVATERMGLASV